MGWRAPHARAVPPRRSPARSLHNDPAIHAPCPALLFALIVPRAWTPFMRAACSSTRRRRRGQATATACSTGPARLPLAPARFPHR